jgi:hypothetical protein
MFWTNVVQKIKTHFVFSIFPPANRVFYEIMWKTFVERGRPQMAIWRMRIACWITETTTTQYVILTTFSLQQWLYERA